MCAVSSRVGLSMRYCYWKISPIIPRLCSIALDVMANVSSQFVISVYLQSMGESSVFPSAKHTVGAEKKVLL